MKMIDKTKSELVKENNSLRRQLEVLQIKMNGTHENATTTADIRTREQTPIEETEETEETTEETTEENAEEKVEGNPEEAS